MRTVFFRVSPSSVLDFLWACLHKPVLWQGCVGREAVENSDLSMVRPSAYQSVCTCTLYIHVYILNMYIYAYMYIHCMCLCRVLMKANSV